MRIGIAASTFSDTRRTGIGRYTFELINCFLEIAPEHEYFLYSPLPMDKKVKETWCGRKNVFFREGNFPIRYLWQIFRMGSWMKKDKIDKALIVDGILPLFSDVPMLAVVHDLIWHDYPKTASKNVYMVFKYNLKRSVKKAFHCAVDSIATKNDLIKYAGLNENKVSVVYLGVDKKFSRSDDISISKTIFKYRIKSPYILYIGNLMMHKNLQNLIKGYSVFCRLCEKDKIVPASLVIAGCRNWRDSSIRKTVKESGVENSVNFLDYIPDEDIPALYSGADVFAFPSLKEGFGLPLLEASACGAPIACSSVSCIPEVAGDSALYFDPLSAEDIAEKIFRIYADKKFAAELTVKGYENIKKFSWEKTAQSILNILEEKTNS